MREKIEGNKLRGCNYKIRGIGIQTQYPNQVILQIYILTHITYNPKHIVNQFIMNAN
jgi:hypothetical protein